MRFFLKLKLPDFMIKMSVLKRDLICKGFSMPINLNSLPLMLLTIHSIASQRKISLLNDELI